MASETAWNWSQWSPRAEIAPRCALDGGRLIVIGDGNPAAYGGFQATVRVDGGHAYEFVARCRIENLEHPPQQIHARLDWLDAKGERLRPCDYAQIARNDDDLSLIHI